LQKLFIIRRGSSRV